MSSTIFLLPPYPDCVKLDLRIVTEDKVERKDRELKLITENAYLIGDFLLMAYFMSLLYQQATQNNSLKMIELKEQWSCLHGVFKSFPEGSSILLSSEEPRNTEEKEEEEFWKKRIEQVVLILRSRNLSRLLELPEYKLIFPGGEEYHV